MIKYYKLVMKGTNGHQESTTTIVGFDDTVEAFIDRAWEVYEKGSYDPEIVVAVWEPDDYGTAGGFAPIYPHKLYENGTLVTRNIKDFPW